MSVDPHRCGKCGERLREGWGGLCGWCRARFTSLNAQVALAQHGPLTLEQRAWLWQWFLQTNYFRFHRRMSRGRAKKLLQAMNSSV